jgi:hypothetical protein
MSIFIRRQKPFVNEFSISIVLSQKLGWEKEVTRGWDLDKSEINIYFIENIFNLLLTYYE